MALLKEILYRCPRRKEALFTLEEKLCAQLRELEGLRIQSFEDSFGITFRQYLEENREYFDIAVEDNDLIVSRVADSQGKGGTRTSGPSESQTPTDSPWRRVSSEGVTGADDENFTEADTKDATKSDQEDVIKADGKDIRQADRLKAVEENKKDENQAARVSKRDNSKAGIGGAGKMTYKVGRASTRDANKADIETRKARPTASSEPLSPSSSDSFVASCLRKEPGDTLIFRVSNDVYKHDPVQFSLDIVSLWNTPDRQNAFIVMGIKRLVSGPHQVVGLKSGSNHAFYRKLFLQDYFDAQPKFTYRETLHEEKLVGVIEVDQSAGSVSPSLVTANKKKTRLRKNDLWVRRDGKNTAVTGSDMKNDLVRRIYSWFMGSAEPSKTHKLEDSERSEPNLDTSNAGIESLRERKTKLRGGTSGCAVFGESSKARGPADMVSLDSGEKTPLTTPRHGLQDSADTGDSLAQTGAGLAEAESDQTRSTAVNPDDISATASLSVEEGTDIDELDSQQAVPVNTGSVPDAIVCDKDVPGAIREDYTMRLKNTPDASTTSSHAAQKTTETSELMTSLGDFKKGHFILLCGTLPYTVPNLNALSTAPWIAVYDFDVSSRDTGLLAYMETGLRNTRGVSVLTWMDPHTGVTERGTQWWSLRGRLDEPASDLSDLPPMKWIKKVCNKVDKLCMELARFGQDYTILNMLVLWPNSEEERRCMQIFLFELQKRVQAQPSILLCFTDPEVDHFNTSEVQSIVEDSEDRVLKFFISLEELCIEIEHVTISTDPGKCQYQLPSGEGECSVSPDQAAWLRQDVEVLYLRSPHTGLTGEDLQLERENFFRGGTIHWFARYDTGNSSFDVERSTSETVTTHIQRAYIDQHRGGVVHLLHAPGSGGTTMSQRILFDLRKVTPCAQVMRNTGSSTEAIVERLTFLSTFAHMPVVALFDGEDEQKLRHLRLMLRRYPVVFLCVKRYPYPIDCSRLSIEHKSEFYLPGTVTKRESRNLVLQFGNHCSGAEGKLRALQTLDRDVQQDHHNHQMFEYGMTVFNHEFKGVGAYVRGYLQVEQSDLQGLQSWQKCLGYLSLCYYYAHCSLPCRFIGGLIEEVPDSILAVHDLPYWVRMLVTDATEGRRGFVRIMHFTIAVEILEQLLNHDGPRSGDENLSSGAKQNLHTFCLEFLNQVVTDGEQASDVLRSVLTETFILRNSREIMEDDAESSRKPQFSQIMLDLDSHPPYRGRLEVLLRLCEICPDDANLRAHLGRFYSLCRPEEEDLAEETFKKAVQLATETDHTSKTDLAYIYHMYGCFLRRKIHRSTTDEYFSSVASIITDAERACEMFTSCRFSAPADIRQAHQYFTEVDVRLQVCRLIDWYCQGGFQALLSQQQTTTPEYRFVKDSILEIQDLLNECFSSLELDDSEMEDLHKRIKRFNATFKGYVTQLQALVVDDAVTSLRLKITAKKLLFQQADDRRLLVQNPHMPSEVIDFVVSTLEQIFSHSSPQHKLNEKLELDYREWILAIRHPNFRQVRKSFRKHRRLWLLQNVGHITFCFFTSTVFL